jgi:folate-binding protein YgfZ
LLIPTAALCLIQVSSKALGRSANRSICGMIRFNVFSSCPVPVLTLALPMAFPSPLEPFFSTAGAVMMPYGGVQESAVAAAAAAVAGEAPGANAAAPISVLLVAACGPVEIEYASTRRGCGLFDNAARSIIELRGADRLDFLNRMLTQELKGVLPGSVRRSFWLNRKGRIDADIRLTHLSDRTLLDVDVLAGKRTLDGIGAYIITEDCTIADRTQELHVLSLHGPTAWEVVRAASEASHATADESEAALLPTELAKDAAIELTIAGSPVVVSRDDQVGECGLHLIVPASQVQAVASVLISAGHDAGHSHEPLDAPGRALRVLGAGGRGLGLHVIGWHAFNLARLEGGCPLYNIDFGPGSLPAETGVMMDRVSVTKGCYLGQEVVARMHARGQAKQVLVAVKFETVRDGEGDEYPIAPEPPVAIALADKPDEALGTLTSAAYAPRLGFAPIAFGQVKPALATSGTIVVARVTKADGTNMQLQGVVQPKLAFWPNNAVKSGAM